MRTLHIDAPSLPGAATGPCPPPDHHDRPTAIPPLPQARGADAPSARPAHQSTQSRSACARTRSRRRVFRCNPEAFEHRVKFRLDRRQDHPPAMTLPVFDHALKRQQPGRVDVMHVLHPQDQRVLLVSDQFVLERRDAVERQHPLRGEERDVRPRLDQRAQLRRHLLDAPRRVRQQLLGRRQRTSRRSSSTADASTPNRSRTSGRRTV